MRLCDHTHGIGSYGFGIGSYFALRFNVTKLCTLYSCQVLSFFSVVNNHRGATPRLQAGVMGALVATAAALVLNWCSSG